MDRPGRNDPCYCGSGKKYKQCHMVADLAADREERAWAEAARELRLAIFEFADDPRFEDAVSYTHLDVYKRQTLVSGFEHGIHAGCGAGQRNSWSLGEEVREERCV